MPQMTNSLEQQLLKTIESFLPDMVDFCRRLIQTPSVNDVHDEVALAEVIADKARRLGLDVQVVGEYAQRPNVIVTAGAGERTGLLLLGHLDTVPPGDESAWNYPPFSGVVADGRIYWRGAVDTKGGMVAALYALAAVARHSELLAAGRVQLVCVPDEESGATGTLGIRYLAAHGLLDGRGAIYAYSGDQITLGHRGLLRYRLTCRGEAIHTGASDWQDGRAGANAVTGMARLLVALEELDFPYSTARYFERFKTFVTPGTVIQGGVSINIVPATCEALVDIRLTPEHDVAAIERLLEQEIDRITNPRLHFEYERLNFAPAAISDETDPFFALLEQVVKDVKHVQPERVVAGPANEGYLLIEHGIPTVCGLGPTGENAHADNEYVEIQGLVDAASIFALTASRLSRLL